MKVYHNNEKNRNKRNEPFIVKMVHYMITFGLSSVFSFFYYLLASFFMYNSNFKKINSSLVSYFVRLVYFLNTFLLRKNIFKTFDVNDLPKSGCFMIFNHVNEFEYPYDFYFGKGIPVFDMGAKKLGLLFPFLSRMGIGLYASKEIKKSLQEIKEYLNFSNIIFYPEGERSFSNSPMEYKKGILKLIYDQKYKTIIFYKGGMEKLDRNLYYYKSEVIDPISFNNFKDFYSHLIQVTTDYHKDFLEKIK